MSYKYEHSISYSQAPSNNYYHYTCMNKLSSF